ncbi:MAG: ABC transporter substrate-binding protein, partial [Candidatus Eremiobacteraeota bacterium]|nr:ABC transporter substrate-binding protein [Candidatus Eremiobacteraeota bacterium]
MTRPPAVSRQSFLKTAAAGGAALSFPVFVPSRTEAEETIKIGETDELTGTYAALGLSQQRGEQLAMEKWNKRGGVLGRKVELVTEDNAADPGIAVQKARKLIQQDKVVALIGTVSSAVALATSAAANSLNTIFMDAGGHADEITGSKCHWNTFQMCHTTWALTHASGFSTAEKYGKRWYLITPDYAFGHALAHGYEDVSKKIGGTIVGQDLVPLGTTDFSSYLSKVSSAKIDVLLVLNNGEDYINTMKQANTFGLFKKVAVGGPYAELEALWALPPVARVGYWGAEWYYKDDIVLGKANSEARTFVSEYNTRFGTPPTARSAFGYVSMDRLLWGIEKAKSTESVKVARALEGAEFTSIWDGPAAYRKEDHALLWPMWVG